MDEKEQSPQKDNWHLLGFTWALIAIVLLGLWASKYLMLPVDRSSVIFTIVFVLSVIFAIFALIFSIKGIRQVDISKSQKIMAYIGLVLSIVPLIAAFVVLLIYVLLILMFALRSPG